MGQRVELFQVIVDTLRTASGSTSPELRQQLNQLPANPDSLTDFPVALQTYIAKVARHAYKVTDEDIATLQSHGYTEDMIWEITLAVAIGAGKHSLDHGLAALQGAIHAPENH
jgi:alkylhydroperoxidase family enzyme